MKKRTLSLIMALCMVVLALPFAAIPVVAAEKLGFTTRLHGGADSDTWPTYESGQALKRFNGNWTMGYFDDGVYRQHYDFAKGNNIVTTGEAWTNTGVFLESGQMILTQGNNDKGAAFYELSTFTGDPVSEANVNKVAGVMAYTAPYTGTVELDVYSMFGVERELNNIEGVTKTTGVYFAIFINGEMVWPNQGDYYAQPYKWAKLATKEDFNELRGEDPIVVDVQTRDVIQFAAALAPQGTSYFFMQPMVTYRDGYQVVPDQVTQLFNSNDHDWPEIGVVAGEGMPLDQTSELWTIGAFNKSTGAFEAYSQYTKQNNGQGYAHTPFAQGESGKPWINEGGIVLSHAKSYLIGAMSVSKSADLRAGYQKTAIANGKLSVTLENAAIANGTGEKMKNATVNLEIYINGTLKGTAAISTDAQGEVKKITPATVDVARGDVITIIADDFGSAGFVGGYPVVTYSDIVSFMNGVAEGENDIAVEEINIKVDGNINLVLNAFATRNVYENADSVTLYIWDNDVTGEKTLDNATAVLPMEMNSTLFSYQAIYNGFAIKELADDLTVRVIAKNGDTVLCSDEITVNPAAVAYDDYLAAADKKMKTLYANLLNYAAYAQTYFGYNTDNLANASLPADLKALDYDMLYDAQFTVTKPTGNAQISDSEIGSFALILDNTISIRAYIERWATEMADTHGFYFQYGETLAGCYNQPYRDRPADERLSLIIDDIGAHEMSDVHYFRAVVTYQFQTATGGTRERQYFGYAMSYSVESYVSRMLESTEPGLEDLVRAMMEFGKAAAAVY